MIMTDTLLQNPDITVSARETFNIDTDLQVPAFSTHCEYVPEVDPSYIFNHDVTLAILAGLAHNRKTLIQGFHGTGKSTHIEQVAARLNWPCVRINLDGHITRTDLIGKDIITTEDGVQVTKFHEGIIPWSLKHNIILVLDEYDAARPDVMFIIQRLLEQNGKFTLLEKNKVITPHESFRLFATANTIGLGDATGLYHGTQPINQGQMDRWNIVASLNYLPSQEEENIILSKLPNYNNKSGKELVKSMVQMAGLTRQGFMAGDISCVMSPRTVLTWAENNSIFESVRLSFCLTFLNKCDEEEKTIIAEYYQRCFGEELDYALIHKTA